MNNDSYIKSISTPSLSTRLLKHKKWVMAGVALLTIAGMESVANASINASTTNNGVKATKVASEAPQKDMNNSQAPTNSKTVDPNTYQQAMKNRLGTKASAQQNGVNVPNVSQQQSNAKSVSQQEPEVGTAQAGNEVPAEQEQGNTTQSPVQASESNQEEQEPSELPQTGEAQNSVKLRTVMAMVLISGAMGLSAFDMYKRIQQA